MCVIINMNNCRIPNFPGGTMRFISIYIDMSDDEDDDDDRCTSWRYFQSLPIIWAEKQKLMAFAYAEEAYYEYQCY